MGFFNNIGVTPPTKDNIYSLFVIPNADGHSWGKSYARKSSAGLRIVIDNEIRSNIKGVRYVSQGKDYDTEEIVRGLTEEHLCIEDIPINTSPTFTPEPSISFDFSTTPVVYPAMSYSPSPYIPGISAVSPPTSAQPA